MPPTQQCLDPDHGAAVGGHDRLVLDIECLERDG